MTPTSNIPVPKAMPVEVITPRRNRSAYRVAPAATLVTVPNLRQLQAVAPEMARENRDATVHRGYVILTTREQAAAPEPDCRSDESEPWDFTTQRRAPISNTN